MPFGGLNVASNPLAPFIVFTPSPSFTFTFTSASFASFASFDILKPNKFLSFLSISRSIKFYVRNETFFRGNETLLNIRMKHIRDLSQKFYPTPENHSRPLFNLFSTFTDRSTTNVKNYPSSVWCRDSNSRPLHHQSIPIFTTLDQDYSPI